MAGSHHGSCDKKFCHQLEYQKEGFSSIFLALQKTFQEDPLPWRSPEVSLARAAHAPPKHSGRNNVISMRGLFAPAFFLHENNFFFNCRPKLQAMFTTFSQLNFLEEISIVKRTFTILLNFLGLYCSGAHFSKVPVNRCVCRYSLQNNL